MNDCCIKGAQAAGIIGSAFAAGSITSISTMTMQTILVPPRKPTTIPSDVPPGPGAPITHLTHQWLHVYDKGKKIFPTIALASTAAFGYLAFTLGDREPGKSWCYVAAATVTAGIVPFTLGAMQKVNNQLAAHATRDDAAVAEGREAMKISEAELARRERDDAEALRLLRRWSCLNFARGLLPLVGAAIGVYATFCA